jgi:hypothetical protein
MPVENLQVFEDRSENLDSEGEWRVEYQDDEGGCYVAIFAGPQAERRARDYHNALRDGTLQSR